MDPRYKSLLKVINYAVAKRWPYVWASDIRSIDRDGSTGVPGFDCSGWASSICALGGAQPIAKRCAARDFPHLGWAEVSGPAALVLELFRDPPTHVGLLVPARALGVASDDLYNVGAHGGGSADDWSNDKEGGRVQAKTPGYRASEITSRVRPPWFTIPDPQGWAAWCRAVPGLDRQVELAAFHNGGG